jgi:hypothetical protein
MRRSLLSLLFAVLVALPASAQSGPEASEDQGLYLGLDRLLERVDARYRVGADQIATSLEPNTRVTVEASHTGMNVDAEARIVEVLEGNRFKVELANGSQQTVTAAQLRKLNTPYSLPDGAGVMAGGSKWSGPIAMVDRVNDPHLKAFLGEVQQIAASESNQQELMRKLTKLVNQKIKYPGHETPDTHHSQLQEQYKGRELAFGKYLEVGEGVCRHKALAIKLALEHVNIPSRYVPGDALNSQGQVRGGHAWVEAITADGKRWLVDPTWNDPGIPLEEAYRSGKLRRPKPGAQRIVPPGQQPIESRNPVDGPDLFRRYRRADGTVDWRRVPGQTLKAEAAGVAHFAFALFLKELPPVLLSGDAARLEEFVELLTSVDFFVTYGLFSVGARAGEAAFERLAMRRTNMSAFTHGLLKTQVALAAGILVPQLVREGRHFDGRAYVIDVAALGLSVTAVKGAVAALQGPLGLRKLRLAARVGRAGAWVYSAAELAVILTVGEAIESWLNKTLDRRSARKQVRDAARALLELDADASTAEAENAIAALANAMDAWRNLLFAPVQELQTHTAAGLRHQARASATAEVARESAQAFLPGHDALIEFLSGRHGSVDTYVAGWSVAPTRGLSAGLQEADENLSKALRAVYEADRRAATWIPHGPANHWVLRGGVPGAQGDPGKQVVFGRQRLRQRAFDTLATALGERLSENRLQTYEDERSLLLALRLARPGWATALEARQDELDAAVELEETMVLPLVDRGLVQQVGSAGR